MKGVLQTCPETLELLKEAKVEVHHELTADAVKIYNELVAENKCVAGLFHSTC